MCYRLLCIYIMLLKMKKIGNSYHLLLPMSLAKQYLSSGFVDITINERYDGIGESELDAIKEELEDEIYIEEDTMEERSKFEGA